MLSRTISVIAGTLLAGSVLANEPISFSDQLSPLSTVSGTRIEALDRQALLAEDAARETQPGVAPRFAIPHPVSISPQSNGSWETAADGTLVWRHRILAPDALSINLGFSSYYLPEGAELHLFSQGGKYRIRPFTAADNKPHGQLWTPVLEGDSLVLELQVPAAAREQVELEIGSINYGYRGFFEPAAPRSGACNVDVVCPEGDAWQTQINSVAVISTGGGTFCTGFMVNNVEFDGTPYFMTANHCGIGAGDAPSLVTYWNYQNSTCRTPGSGASGGPGDGTLDQFNTGSTLRATLAASDFTLLELDSQPDPAWNVAYAGWDARDQATTSAIAVHHPSTDEKRISFEDDPTSITDYLSNTPNPAQTHIRVEDWDVGTTEPGSSGSPLFSPEGRVIGQLHGGFAACGNDDADWYGRMARSWGDGGSATTRLRDWLDPNDSGTLVVDALGDEGFGIEPATTELSQCGFADIDVPVTIAQFGSFAESVTLSTSGEPAGMSTGFSTNPVTPPGSSTLSLTTLAAAGAGSYDITIAGDSASQTRQATISLNLAEAAPVATTITAPGNGSVGVGTSPTMVWDEVATAGEYGLEIATDSGFTDVVYSAVENGTSHTVTTALSPNTVYYVRVRTTNDCGDSAWSTAISFTTANLICIAPNTAIPDDTPAGLDSDLIVGTAGILEGLEMTLDITHTWVGDLIISLEHVDTGTSIELVNRANGANPTFGCNSDNIQTGVSDGAALSLQANCNDGDNPDAYPEATYSPNDPLAGFIGEDLAGTWRLSVSDNAGQDTGTLNEWCLLPAVEASDAFSIGGTVTGLEGSGLVLQNNGDELTINGNGPFAFPDQADGTDYEVTILTDPTSPSQTCEVTNGSGTVSGADVDTIQVSCVTDLFTVGGAVTGLEGSGLVLQNNGDELTINGNGPFAFPAQADGTDYEVTILTDPTSPSQTCEVTNGSGTVSGADVDTIQVSCVTDLFTVGGAVTGLDGSGLVLQNNGGELTINSNGPFAFPAQADGTDYEVTILTDPTSPSQTCEVTNGSGTVSGADVDTIQVSCVTDLFTVGGTVTGLQGSGLVLQNNGNNLTINGNGPFTFPAQADGTDYEVEVVTQPPGQECNVAQGIGMLAGADITDVAVDCSQIEIALDVTSLEFTGSPSTSQFVTISNAGAAQLIIDSFDAPEAPFTFDPGSCAPLPRTLSVGQSCTVEIGVGPLSGGALDDELVINSNAISSPDRVALRGIGAAIPVTVLSPLGLLLLILLSALVARPMLQRG